MKSLSIVIPAYNEEANIRTTVSEVAGVAHHQLGLDYEIILVNDGSRDRTGEIGRELAAYIPELRLVEHYPNRGYGGALKAGFAAARNDLIAFFPADNQFHFEEITRLLESIVDENADIVCGYRVDRQDPFIRKINALGWNTLVRLLFGYLCRDIDCGFKLFRREVLADMTLESDGALIDTEFLSVARAQGFRIAEVPVTHRPRISGEATGANLRVIIKAFRDLLKLFRQHIASTSHMKWRFGVRSTFFLKEKAMKKRILVLAILVLLLLVAQLACSLPGIADSSEGDVAATRSLTQQSPVGEAVELTPVPHQSDQEGGLPGAQSQGGTHCHEGFVGTANIANGQEFQPDESFQVVWTIENTGTCTWGTGHALKLLGGEISSAESLISVNSTVVPGGSITLSVDMQAPSQPGNYISAWKMQDDQGHMFGQDSPPDSPLRVAIKVVPSGGGGNSPAPTPESQTAESAPDMLIQGTQQTLLDGQCFDLVSGQEVDCSDASADILYQYTTILGGKIYGENDTDLAGSVDDEPDKSFCENESYSPLPHSVLEEKFFCFKSSHIVNTYYGWIRIERFDEDGITFDFVTFKPDAPEVQPAPNLFIESQGDQVTMLTDQCFDLHHGEVIDCAEPFAIFEYHQVTKKSLQVMEISGMDPSVRFSTAMSSQPSLSDCQGALTSASTVIWPLDDTMYYCYVYVPGMVGYYGWLRPTQHDSNGMTFDYLTWKTSP